MKKNFFALFVAAAAVTVLCVGSAAVADFSDAANPSGSCGGKLYWEFDTESGELIITGSGPMTAVGAAEYVPWYSYRSSITSVSLPDGITTIAQFSFCNCTNLGEVTLPEGVTIVGIHAFDYCTSLKTVTIPSTILDKYSIGNVFTGCYPYITVYDNTTFGISAGDYGLPSTATIVRPGTTIEVKFYDGGSLYATETETVGKQYVFPEPPTGSELDFVGWYTAAGARIADNAVVTKDDATSLYAGWGFYITFMDGGDTVDTLPERVGEKYVFPDDPAGAGFIGWYTAAGVKIAGDAVVAEGDATTLYAGWGFSVTFRDGGDTVDTLTERVGEKYVFPEMSPKTGQTCYWFTGEGGSGKKVTSATTVAAGDATVLYAYWTGSRYTVTADANGGTLLKETAEVTYGRPAYLDDMVTWDGHIIREWNTDSGGAGTSFHSGDVWNFDSDETMYPIWAQVVYVKFYDGGTLVDTVTEFVGEKYTFPSLSPKTGYTFDAWYTGEGGTGKEITSATTVAAGDAAALYAHWAGNTYTVTADANGGTLLKGTAEVTYGQPAYLDDMVTMEGHKVMEWNTDSEGGGTSFHNGDNWHFPADTKLYPIWAEVQECVVTFNPGDGEVAGGRETVIVTYGAVFDFEQYAVLTGYHFSGWYTEDGTRIITRLPSEFTEDTTLYAHWTARTFEVLFDANGGILSGDSVVYATYGQPFVFGQSAVFGDFIFDGWYTAHSGGTEIESGYVWDIASYQVLYARWSTVTSKVTFDAGDGDLRGDGTVNADYGSRFFFTQYAFLEGYDFSGWFTEVSGGTRVVSGGIFEYSENITLYAHWTARQYKVTFDAYGGTLSAESTATATYGQPFVFDQSAVRTGYNFCGWFTAAVRGTEIESQDVWNIDSDQVLYARWSAVASKVTFDACGGELLGDETIDAVYGSRLFLVQSAVLEGYVFEGWFSQASGGTAVTSGSMCVFVKDTILYAHWAVCKCTVTFSGNGGTISGQSTATATYGTEFTFSPSVSYAGHTFLGWFTDPVEGTKVAIGKIWTVTSDTVLFAHWEAVTVKITFDPGDGVLVGDTAMYAVYGSKLAMAQYAYRDGYRFAGWFTEDETKIVNWSISAFTEDVTLYAHWRETTDMEDLALCAQDGACPAARCSCPQPYA